ncbi:MAG: cytidylate kinase-like family protein [Lachnospiraceae bacterium]|nr:cytidylate kinase-like family protein [Lachnospiraceae bacterium]
MSSQLIISIGREFGSGGHEIAQKLADYYHIPLLDHNLLDEIAAEKQLDVKNFHGLDEKKKKIGLSRTVRGFSSSPEENLSLLQFDYLRKKAAKGESFVIVGRCSEDVLKDYEGLISIFILGDKKVKVKRVMELYDLSEYYAEKFLTEKDMKRKRYHNSFCEGKWGDSRNYDLSINSSKLGIEDTITMLIQYIDMRKMV